MYFSKTSEEVNYYAYRKYKYNDKVAAFIERNLFAQRDYIVKTYGERGMDVLWGKDAYLLSIVLGKWTGGYATKEQVDNEARGSFRTFSTTDCVINRTDNRIAKSGSGVWTKKWDCSPTGFSPTQSAN